jgi:hypothetical protein
VTDTEPRQPVGVQTLRAVTDLFERMQCHDGYALVTYTDLRNLAQKAQRIVIDDLNCQLGADSEAPPVDKRALHEEIVQKGRRPGVNLPLTLPRARSLNVIPSQQRARRVVDQILGTRAQLRRHGTGG